MLREVGVVEQRYQAVREVLNDGASVIDVARRNGVSRQTVHEWLVKYVNKGLVGLMDRSSKPRSCPHQMTPPVEARKERSEPAPCMEKGPPRGPLFDS